MSPVTTIEQLEAIYGTPREAAVVKETDRITDHYRAFIEASPFALLATAGPGGADCSPKGDLAGFVRVKDSKTLLLPDRFGNNRIDSLRNIVVDGRAALLFLVPGVGNMLRVNGRATIDVDPSLLATFAVEGKAPRSVLVLAVESVYFHCARAVIRSSLWNPAKHVDPKSLPSMGEILQGLAREFDGKAYDVEWPERAKKTMW